MPEHDELDLLIDSALRDYAEPRAGLEKRMQARVSVEAIRPRPRRWVLAVAAVSGMAVMVLLIYLIPWDLQQRPSQVASLPARPVGAPIVSTSGAHEIEKAVAPSPRGIRRRVQTVNRTQDSATTLPKLDVFPTPQPMTDEEQALVRFFGQVPEADRKALVEAQQHMDEPLNISAIQIPPLQLPEVNQN